MDITSAHIARIPSIFLILIVLVLTSCGGGGGGDGSGGGTTFNSAPTANSVNITGATTVGSILTGHYTYTDVDGDAEGASSYRWLRNGIAITGATDKTYTLSSADSGYTIIFEVTPVAATGITTGTAVASAGVTGDIIVNNGGGTGILNDTGITWGGNYPSGNNTTCIGETIGQQDCKHGRDARAAAGTLNKIGAGAAGFDFTKLDANGNTLTNQTVAYTTTPWDCVKDNVTGLEWEVKTIEGGLRDKGWTYMNNSNMTGYDPTSNSNNGSCLKKNTDSTAFCTSEAYVNAVNIAGLCGKHDWRMPKTNELMGIMDLGHLFFPAVDSSYFPNNSYLVWSGSPYAYGSNAAWSVGGHLSKYHRSSNFALRLVRSGQ